MTVVVRARQWIAAIVLSVMTVTTVQAQRSVAEELAAGEREIAARKPAVALTHFEAALALAPNNYHALWRTSSTLIDLSEFDTDSKRRKAAFERAGVLARQAIAANPNDAAGHFHLARALGREALSVSARERTKYALDVREAALRALAIDSSHAGALHVMGRWHAEVMRLNGVTRMIARTFMGGKVFGEASWRESVRLLERATAVEPNRTVHQLALAQVYRDSGDANKARTLFEAAIRAPLFDANDEAYKREARRDLAALR